VWANGRVRREYVGAWDSPTAQVAAAEDRMRREAKERALADRRAVAERLAALDAPVLVLDALGDALLAATLVAGGFHRHDRGEWRRRRDRTR
jgi:hypothetical protein